MYLEFRQQNFFLFFIRRSGQFYLHDTRDGEEGNELKGEEAEEEEANEVEDPETKKAALQLKIKNDAWGHDLYDDQAPLSTEEIINKYGYDIRAHPPDAPPPTKFDRGNRGRQGYGRSDRPDRRQQRNDFFQPRHQQQEEKPQRGGFTDNRRVGGSRRQNEYNAGRHTEGRSNARSHFRDRDNQNTRYQSDARQPFDRDFPPLPQKSVNGEDRYQNPSYSNRDFIKSSERPRRGRGGNAGYTNDRVNGQQNSFNNGWKNDRRMGNDDRSMEQPKSHAHVKRVTNQPPALDQGKFQRGGFHENGNRAPPNRSRNKLPEWATEDPPDAMWEPEAEEPHSMRPPNQGSAHYQQQQHHHNAQSRQTTTFYNRNLDQPSQGQHGHRYSSMRSNVRQQEGSPKNIQSQKSRYQNQRESPVYRKDDGNYDDYDSQGEADWQGLESPAKTKSPQKPVPQRIANSGPPPHHHQNGGTESSKPPQQQGTDATAIAAATIQQLLSNPGLLQQLLVAATASSNAASSAATPAASASMTTTTSAPSQHQVHHHQPSQAHQYRQPVASYYHPHSVAAPQPTTSTPSASEFLNNMTPQQAAAFQAAALNMFSGSAPPNAGQALPAGFMAPSAAASAGTAYYFQSPEANATATHHFVAATATPPQASMRHGHHHNR